MNPRRILSQAALVVGAVLFSIGLQTFAFTQPTAAPPNVDTYAPLTTGPTAEAKTGGLLLNTGAAANGLIVQSGKVGIGVASPSQLLDVAGYVKGTGICIVADCRTVWPTSGVSAVTTASAPIPAAGTVIVSCPATYYRTGCSTQGQAKSSYPSGAGCGCKDEVNDATGTCFAYCAK